jgi:hypothetical protein
MQRSAITRVCVVAVCAVAAVAVAAVAAGQGEQSAAASSITSPSLLTFHLTEGEGHDHLVDNAPQDKDGRITFGDEGIFRHPLYDMRHRRVGSVHALCAATVGGTDPTITCSGMISLRSGRLAWSEISRFSDQTHHIAVTGGTQRYEGATGSITSGPPNPDVLTFRLVLP